VWGGELCAVRLDREAAPIFVPCSSSGSEPDGEYEATSSASSRLRQFDQRFDFQLRLPDRHLLRRAVGAVLDDADRELRQHFTAQLIDQLAVAGLQRRAATQRHALPLRGNGASASGSIFLARTLRGQLELAHAFVAFGIASGVAETGALMFMSTRGMRTDRPDNRPARTRRRLSLRRGT
jgi:hypothetical protein